MKMPVYMDAHATTPVDPRVLEVMTPFHAEIFGNPSSESHVYGTRARKAVEEAREMLARFVGAEPGEIYFTSGATESNNWALKGLWEACRSRGRHIITQKTEHKSVLETCKYLEKQGAQVTYLPVDAEGRVRLQDIEKHLTPETLVISVMAANNEIGTLQPLAEIGRIAKARGVYFHVDGAQAAGKFQVNMETLGVDLFSWNAHKMYGPKGVGALYVRRKNPHVRLAPLLHGGEHERGLRAGTLNVPAIAGFARACEIATAEMAEESRRQAALRDRLQAGFEKLGRTRINGCPAHRLAGNLNISFAGVEAEALMMKVGREVALSASSACTSGNTEPSHVLKALEIPREFLHGAVRFGLGRFTTEAEVDFVIERVSAAVRMLREVSPFYTPEGDQPMASAQ